MCGTVTPPSADCESSIFLVRILVRGKRGRLLAPRLAACNIVGHTPVVEPKNFQKLKILHANG